LSALEPLDWRAPDLVEPVVGFRQWRAGELALSSLFNDTPWPSAELTARCDLGDHDPALVPAQACSCGVYAYYDPCPRTASVATADFVSGAVVLWGRLELHATGMRASHARVVALELPLSRGAKRRRLSEIADRFGVAVVPHRHLKAAAREHGLPLPASLRPPRSWATSHPDRPVGFLPRTVSSALTAATRHARPERDRGLPSTSSTGGIVPTDHQTTDHDGTEQ